MRFSSCLLPPVFAVLAAPALSAPTVPLAKVGKWEVNYDADSCHLIGNFGTGNQAIRARMTRYNHADNFDLVLFGKPVAFENRAGNNAEITFGNMPPFKVRGLSGSVGKDIPLLAFSSLRLDGWRSVGSKQAEEIPPAISLEQERAVNAITVKIKFGKAYRLETGPMDKPMSAMRTCLDDLVKHWGYDPAIQASLSRQPMSLTPSNSWLRSDDYPKESLRQGNNGIVRIRLDIDDKGGVVACRVIGRTSPDEFADLSCKLITQRARFDPALDAQSKPVRSFFVAKILWLSFGS